MWMCYFRLRCNLFKQTEASRLSTNEVCIVEAALNSSSVLLAQNTGDELFPLGSFMSVITVEYWAMQSSPEVYLTQVYAAGCLHFQVLIFYFVWINYRKVESDTYIHTQYSSSSEMYVEFFFWRSILFYFVVSSQEGHESAKNLRLGHLFTSFMKKQNKNNDQQYFYYQLFNLLCLCMLEAPPPPKTRQNFTINGKLHQAVWTQMWWTSRVIWWHEF